MSNNFDHKMGLSLSFDKQLIPKVVDENNNDFDKIEYNSKIKTKTETDRLKILFSERIEQNPNDSVKTWITNNQKFHNMIPNDLISEIPAVLLKTDNEDLIITQERKSYLASNSTFRENLLTFKDSVDQSAKKIDSQSSESHKSQTQQ